MGFPTKNDHFGVFWGYPYFRKPPYREYLSSHVFGTIKESQNFLLAQQNDICVGKKVTLLSPFSSPKPPNFHPIKIKNKPTAYMPSNIDSAGHDRSIAMASGSKIEITNSQGLFFFLMTLGGFTFSMQGTLVFIRLLYVGDEVVLPSYQRGL